MLVITRTQGQSVQIGDNIVIKITRVKGGNVRLGIHCPREVVVVRLKDEEENHDKDTP